ncbi:MAG TPA: hypothetical protein VER33_15340 [Polyangiaceae bacterium]|nr:hypothetical protein [Polyangiaceae bacterium]
MRSKFISLAALFLLVSACGGSEKPPAESPEGAAAEDASESTPAAPEASGDGESETKEKASDSPAASDAADKGTSASTEPTLTRTPRDILTAPDVIFMFSFTASDMREAAEQKCDAQAKSDPKKRADCMNKEKQKIAADGIRFKQEKGRWYWMTVRRKGNTLVNLHKVPVEFVNEAAKSVVLKPVGKDEGTGGGRAPGETAVEVPNDYQIIFNDPQHGKMVYEAKIGITGE